MRDRDFRDQPQSMDELYDMVEENNEMLRSMARTHRLRSFGKVFKLVIWIAIFVALVVFVRPYFQNAKRIYDSVTANVERLQSAGDTISDGAGVVNSFFGNITNEVEGFGDTLEDIGGDIGVGDSF